RRGRPPDAHPRPPLEELHHARLGLPLGHDVGGRPRRRHVGAQRRHPRGGALPGLHGPPAPVAAPRRPPQALRPAAVHALPQGHRPLARGVPALLAPGVPQHHRRRLQQGVPLQRAPRLRRRRRRRHPPRRRLQPLQLPEDPDRAPARPRRGPRLPLPPL
ncbi:hypothetical protein BN1708_018901, partial [Verticillium longisporum]